VRTHHGRYVVLCAALGVLALVATSADTAAPADGANARSRAWALLASTLSADGVSSFSNWYNEAEVLAPVDLQPDDFREPFPGLPIGAAVAPEQRLQHVADAAVITFVHYDPAAYAHVRKHRLYRRERLDDLMRSGPHDPVYPGRTTIPPLPRQARVLMSAWWPVDIAGATPVPVWDADDVPRPNGSNDYTSWNRIVAVNDEEASRPSAALTFAGRSFTDVRRVGLERFVHVSVDAGMATKLMQDPGARKAALLALGRPLAAGDVLLLVAFHLMAADAGMGTWTTAWWHDRPDTGAFGADRAVGIPGPWRNYLMDVAVDPVTPLEPDGSPNICFNPWFEAKFPDGGQGPGVKSNCISCHERASYPLTAFLPIRRGNAEPLDDPAFAAGRLGTARLWSLANPPADAIRQP
jgi:hypothetical protein